MIEYNAQTGRQVSMASQLTHAQAVSDEDDLAGGLRGLSALVTAGLSLDDLLTTVAGFAAPSDSRCRWCGRDADPPDG